MIDLHPSILLFRDQTTDVTCDIFLRNCYLRIPFWGFVGLCLYLFDIGLDLKWGFRILLKFKFFFYFFILVEWVHFILLRVSMGLFALVMRVKACGI